MGDVTPTDFNRLHQLREQYDRQKQDVRDQYEDQLDSIRDEYNHKIQEEEKSGEAAVNHIHAQVQNHRESAEQSAQSAEKILGQTSQIREENLKRRQAGQDDYFTKAKTKQNQWVEGEQKNLQNEREKVKDRVTRDIDEYRKAQRTRLAHIKDDSREEIQDIHEKGRTAVDATRKQYQDHFKQVKEKQDHDLEETETFNRNRLDAEKKGYRQEEARAKQSDAETLSKTHQQTALEEQKLKAGHDETVKREINRGQKRYAEAVAADDGQLKLERQKDEAMETTEQTKHRQHVQKQDQTEKQELTTMETKHEKEVKTENDLYDKKTKEIKARHEEQRERAVVRNQKELQSLQEAHEERMTSEQLAFENKFAKNSELSRETFTDQELNLGRELVNQKQKFMKAADKYSNKEGDPFYQIRDNRAKFYENSGSYVLKAKVPEYEKDSVQVRVKNDKVMLIGNRSFNNEVNEDGHIIRTNNAQTFNETFDIPKRIREDAVVKNWDNGTLTVIIPKVT